LIQHNNSLRRELNLTQADLAKGQCHYTRSTLFNQVNVSVEAKLAEELGIQVGDKLTFNLPEGRYLRGHQLTKCRVGKFSPNFFFIFHRTAWMKMQEVI
jgi:putative ABC transport system permease protein